MTITEIKNKLNTNEYDFLRTNEHLNNNIGIITLGGSYAYGTNTDTSDIDIRGMFVPTKREIILENNYDQFEERNTDTVLYNISKLFTLLSGCNPNVIEMLGNKPEHYIYLSKYGKLLLDNKKIFLSKRCINTFAGYAVAQLRRLENKCARVISKSEREQHILDTIESAKYAFPDRYPIDSINLYIDDSNKEEFDKEIYIDSVINHVPLRDVNSMILELENIVRSYDKEKLGTRNKRAMCHEKLGKHMMHLLRLYMMCIDILTKEEIITYRENEHDLLMRIRNGEFLDENKQPTSEFFDILNSYIKDFDYAKNNTNLPDKPDFKAIDELKYTIYEDILMSN